MIRSIPTVAATSLFTLAALPVAAQNADLCGGTGANAQWLGSEEATSDLSTAPTYLEQMALVLLRNEYVGLFTVSETGDYRIEAQGRGSGDTVIEVRSATGEIVAADDDSGGGGASRAETSLAPGTYCVSMRSFDGTPLTGFVRAGRMDQAPLTTGLTPTPDDTGAQCDLTTAQTLVLGEPVSQSWATQNTFRIQLDAPMSLTLTAQNEDADPILSLFDANGTRLAENDDFDGLNSRIDMTDPLPAGVYCIALDLYGDEDVPITVTASAFDAQGRLENLYAQGEASPPLDGSYPVTSLGELQTRAREDATIGRDATWYAFDVYEGGLVMVEAFAQGQGDPVLTMFDDLGRQVGYNDDNNGSLDALLAVRVQPGTYLVAVRQLDAQTTGVVRMVFERYVPARP